MPRPIKPAVPGRKAKLSVDVLADIKNRVDAAAHAVGRGQGDEVSARLQWSFDFEDRFGGRRVLNLLQTLASAALKQHPDGDDAWFDDRENYAAVADEWTELIYGARPIDVAKEIEQVRQMLAEFPTLPRRSQVRFRPILANKAELSRLPDELRSKILQVIEPPPSDEMPDEAEVDKAVEVLGIPREQVRQSLARMQAWGSVLGEALDEIDNHREMVIDAARPFMQAWVMAVQTLAGALGRMPEEQEVAEHVAAHPELQIVAGMHKQRAAEEILRYRSEILRLLALPDAPEAA